MKYTERKQHAPSQAKSVVEDRPFGKGIDYGRQGGSTLYFFSFPPTQNIFGVCHMTIANFLTYVSGIYGVFFR